MSIRRYGDINWPNESAKVENQLNTLMSCELECLCISEETIINAIVEVHKLNEAHEYLNNAFDGKYSKIFYKQPCRCGKKISDKINGNVCSTCASEINDDCHKSMIEEDPRK